MKLPSLFVFSVLLCVSLFTLRRADGRRIKAHGSEEEDIPDYHPCLDEKIQLYVKSGALGEGKIHLGVDEATMQCIVLGEDGEPEKFYLPGSITPRTLILAPSDTFGCSHLKSSGPWANCKKYMVFTLYWRYGSNKRAVDRTREFCGMTGSLPNYQCTPLIQLRGFCHNGVEQDNQEVQNSISRGNRCDAHFQVLYEKKKGREVARQCSTATWEAFGTVAHKHACGQSDRVEL